MRDVVRRWWSRPVDYSWVVTYHRSHPILRFARPAIGVWCGLYGVLCVLLTRTPVGPTDATQRWMLGVLAISTVVVGAAWIRGPWPTETLSRMFVVYANVGTAAALATLMAPMLALPCATLFAVIGSYVAGFHGPRMFVVHQLWVSAVCLVLFAHVVYEGGDVVLATGYLVLLTLVLFSAPVLVHVLLLRLRQDAAAAFFDPLTGLRNRRGLDAAITARTVGKRTAVMVIDLDDFKSVNDRFGHQHGDIVLRAAAVAIYAMFPPPAITARTGGEEFAVVTDDTAERVFQRAEQLREVFADRADGYATVSIGTAHTESTENLEQLLGRADLAMYTAKRQGGNAVVPDIAPTDIAPTDIAPTDSHTGMP